MQLKRLVLGLALLASSAVPGLAQSCLPHYDPLLGQLACGISPTSATTNGAIYWDGSAYHSTAAGGAGTLCLTSASGAAPVWGSCSGSPATAFSALTTSSNTTATMTIGTGATLTVSGTGVNNANQLNGGTIPLSAVILGSNASNQAVAATTTGTGTTAVLSASPTFTGTITAAAATLSGLLNSSSGNITLPTGAGFVATVANTIGYDSTNKNVHIWSNGADAINLAIAAAPTTNNCLKASVAAGVVLVADAGAPCGTATSVGASFTGGLISVGGTPVTSSGTLALTVAGTSGGIPYFSGATTWASSAALTANLPVIGGGAGVAPSVGTVSGNTTQFVTTTGTQTSTAAVKIDASGNHIASGVTIDASNNVSTAGSYSSGTGTGNGGYVQLNGATSGSTGWTTPNVSGAQSFFVLPNPNGGSFTNAFLQITGTTTCPTGVPGANCYATAIATPPGAGTVASSTTGQVPVYTAATTVTGNANLTFSGATLTLGVAGAATGGLVVAGGTSGSTTEAYPASGGGTWTHQTGTDTYVGRATTDTLTNKTINCASNTCTIPATNRIRAISISLGYPTNSSALGTSDVQYVTVPFACTISAYNFAIDAADATFKVKWWKVATGTAIPTSANSINTSGVGVPSGTAVHSTSLTDFSVPGLTVSANDIIAMAVATANTVKYINGVLECDQ